MTASAKKGVDLDELESETQKLTALLKDRHPGLSTWNTALQQRLEKIQQLTSDALGNY